MIIELISKNFNIYDFNFQPWVGKRCVFPVPIELIVVLIGTIVSKYSDITNAYSLKVVGHISVG